jgi:hypothetical protein
MHPECSTKISYVIADREDLTSEFPDEDGLRHLSINRLKVITQMPREKNCWGAALCAMHAV